jgi:predicted dehydrogenase
MLPEKQARVLFLADDERECWKPLCDFLGNTRQVLLEFQPTLRLPAELDDYQVLLHTNCANLTQAEEESLAAYVRRGGGCLGFVEHSSADPPPIFGVRAGLLTPFMDLRLRFFDPGHLMARRLAAEFLLNGRFRPLEAAEGGTEPVLVTTWQNGPATAALMRREGQGLISCSSFQACSHPFFQQFIYRLVRHLAGLGEAAPLEVAILGYGPLGSVGSQHGLAIREIPGLNLRAVCDYSPERLLKCREDFPHCRTYSTARDLGRDPEVDLAIIATPPNTHASLAIELLREGKHVVCEKPMCLTREEGENMIRTAEQNSRVLTCFQNRRWDPDYLALRQSLQDGMIGEPFYLETFVGDYRHPCHYWHSHRPISGGALFDWGAHYVDWILNLFPGPTAWVTGGMHKRVWHDVTNADQIRAQIRFADGREAEFLYSDVSALAKPKWYILGTEGAILGQWTELSVRELDTATFYREAKIPPTEAPPLLTVRRRHPSGSMVVHQLPQPSPRPFSFYLNLADHLLTGEPLAVTARSAARVVAVLEAATRSAYKGGLQEGLDV